MLTLTGEILVMKNNILNKRFRNDGYYYVSIFLVAISIVFYAIGNIRVGSYTFNTYLAFTPYFITHKLYLWQFVTYMFVCPMGLWQFLFCMLMLLSFGVSLERQLGSKEFLLFYMFTGIFVSVFAYITCILAKSEFYSLASPYAIILGLEVLFAMLNPYAKVLVYFIIPIRITFLVLFLVALELIIIFLPATGGSWIEIVQLYSLVAAFAYAYFRLRMHPLRFWINTISGKPV